MSRCAPGTAVAGDSTTLQPIKHIYERYEDENKLPVLEAEL